VKAPFDKLNSKLFAHKL